MIETKKKVELFGAVLYVVGTGAYALWMIDLATHGGVRRFFSAHRSDLDHLRSLILAQPQVPVPPVVSSAEELIRESWDRTREHIRRFGELPGEEGAENG